MASKVQTRPSDRPLDELFVEFPNDERRADAQRLIALMAGITGHEPIIWGDRLIGFGRRSYRYASGRSDETFELGFAAHGREMTLYAHCDLGKNPRYHDDLTALGPHRTGVGCLYLKRLQTINFDVLEQVLRRVHADVMTGHA
jgi:hypothetical protein